MSSPQSRLPLLVDLPAGPTAADILGTQLARADADPATVIAPVPLTGPHVSQELRDRVVTAISPDVPIREANGQVVLTTSGSTATAKAVVHSMDAVRSSTRALHEYLGGAGHWLCALPLHTSAGFMTVARAVLSGTVAVPTSSLGGAEPFTSHSFLSACEQMPSTGRRYISLVPAMARRLSEDTAALRALADFDAVLIGGQAVPADLTNVLSQSGAHVVLSYGATETCGGCVYDGHALPGVSVTIGPDNRVIVSGPMVMLGYRSALATQRQQHEGDAPESAQTRSITMPDLGHIDDSGRLHIDGRVDDVVPVNGINVSVSAVETMLRELGLSAIVCIADDILFAVTPTGIAPDESEAAVARVIEHFGVKLRLQVLRDIPLTAAGKPDRRALAAQLSM